MAPDFWNASPKNCIHSSTVEQWYFTRNEQDRSNAEGVGKRQNLTTTFSSRNSICSDFHVVLWLPADNLLTAAEQQNRWTFVRVLGPAFIAAKLMSASIVRPQRRLRYSLLQSVCGPFGLAKIGFLDRDIPFWSSWPIEDNFCSRSSNESMLNTPACLYLRTWSKTLEEPDKLWLSIAVSFSDDEDSTIQSVTEVSFYPVRRGSHRWFCQKKSSEMHRWVRPWDHFAWYWWVILLGLGLMPTRRSSASYCKKNTWCRNSAHPMWIREHDSSN